METKETKKETKRPLFCMRCGVVDLSGKPSNRRYCIPCGPLVSNDRGAKEARIQIKLAIERGELPPAKTQACKDCGEPAVAYDHRDYNKPLEVEPVCVPCNFARGSAVPLGGLVAPSNGVKKELWNDPAWRSVILKQRRARKEKQ